MPEQRVILRNITKSNFEKSKKTKIENPPKEARGPLQMPGTGLSRSGAPFRCHGRAPLDAPPPKGTYFSDVNQNLAYFNPPLPLLVDVNKVRSLRPGAGALLGHKKTIKSKRKEN